MFVEEEVVGYSLEDDFFFRTGHEQETGIWYPRPDSCIATSDGNIVKYTPPEIIPSPPSSFNINSAIRQKINLLNINSQLINIIPIKSFVKHEGKWRLVLNCYDKHEGKYKKIVNQFLKKNNNYKE